MVFLSLFLAGYIVGSFPTSYITGKVLRGIDIRDFGSGNVGATNTFRVLGKRAGVFVLLIDIAKGFLPVSFIAPLIATVFQSEPDSEFFGILSGISAIVGHNWSVFLKFRGGKGVATSVGVLIGLSPYALGVSALIWILVVCLSRYVSLGSITGAVLLPLFMYLFGESKATFFFGIAIAILIILTHRSNILRLVQGKENRIWRKS